MNPVDIRSTLLYKKFYLHLGKTNQGRMDDFFKVSSITSTKTPKKADKRKAGKQSGKNAKKMKKEAK